MKKIVLSAVVLLAPLSAFAIPGDNTATLYRRYGECRIIDRESGGVSMIYGPSNGVLRLVDVGTNYISHQEVLYSPIKDGDPIPPAAIEAAMYEISQSWMLEFPSKSVLEWSGGLFWLPSPNMAFSASKILCIIRRNADNDPIEVSFIPSRLAAAYTRARFSSLVRPSK